VSADRRRLDQRLARVGLVVAALALFAAGCGSSSHTTAAASAPDQTGNTVHVVMAHLEFSPLAVNAKVGQRVVWTNEDSAPHNVTYISGPVFKSSRRVLRPGRKFSITLTQAGTIHYYCTIHPWMRATIAVSQ
jgi:plastocyanin